MDLPCAVLHLICAYDAYLMKSGLIELLLVLSTCLPEAMECLQLFD